MDHLLNRAIREPLLSDSTPVEPPGDTSGGSFGDNFGGSFGDNFGGSSSHVVVDDSCSDSSERLTWNNRPLADAFNSLGAVPLTEDQPANTTMSAERLFDDVTGGYSSIRQNNNQEDLSNEALPVSSPGNISVTSSPGGDVVFYRNNKTDQYPKQFRTFSDWGVVACNPSSPMADNTPRRWHKATSSAAHPAAFFNPTDWGKLSCQRASPMSSPTCEASNPIESGRRWQLHPKKLQRKLCVVEVSGGKSRKLLVQTPELMRMIHFHNKINQVQDTMSGSVKLRDLRQVCAFQSAHRPSIEPRRNCILVNLPRMRGVILHSKVICIPLQDYSIGSMSLTFDDDRDENDLHCGNSTPEWSLIKKLVKLTENRSVSQLEFSVLEAMLVEECSVISTALSPLRTSAKTLIQSIQQEPNKTTKLRQITELKRQIDILSDKARGCRKAIQEVLDNEEDIQRLEISRFWECPDEWDDPPDSAASEDAEMLLECYEQEIDSFLKQLNRIDEELDNALQIQQLHLASVRNILIKAEIGLEMLGVSVAVVGAAAGVLGMNIPNGWEGDSSVFALLSFVFGGFIVITGLLVVWFFRRLDL